MGLNLNFSGVTAAGKFPVFEGDFNFLIQKAEQKPSKAGNSINIHMTLECSDGPQQGETMLAVVNVQDSTMPFVKAFLNAVMNTELDGDFELEVSDLVGMPVGATVTNDGQYNSVEVWYPAT